MPSANLPVRGLGSLGLVRDVEPWDDPVEAWSGGRNVRFEDNKALRSPVFRTVQTIAGSTLSDVAQVVAFRPYSGFDNIFLLDSYGRASQATPGTPLVDVSGSSSVFTPVSAATQFTSCLLGNVFYLNRDTHLPRYWLPSSTAFAPIPNQDTPFTCGVLRGLSSCLVALNVTKSGTNYGTMVKWSDATQAGSVPASWDVTTAATLAGENTLTEADGPIIDAQNLRGSLAIYTQNQIFLMSPTGDKTFPFSFQKLWQDERWGAMGRNCSVEVGGLHYVFGSQDCYVHDGVSPPQSIAEGRVRRFVFSSMDLSQRRRFFVAHDAYLNSVWFCYVSKDADIAFAASGLCNKAAVWNYQNKTWGTAELPNVGGGCNANSDTVRTWANGLPGSTWATMGGSWLDLTDGYKPALLLAGNAATPALPTASLYAVDPLFKNSRINLPVDPYANSSSYLEHAGVPLDRAQIPLHNFKRVRKVVPLVRVYNGQPIQVSVGASVNTEGLPSYGAPVTFDPNSAYRVDTRASGRYVAVRIDAPTLCEYDITGFDLDIVGGGRK